MTSRVCREFLYARTVIVMSAEGGFQTRPYGNGAAWTLEGVRADILALERETEGLLAEILGSGSV